MPALMPSRYCGIRMNPCESCPARLASARWFATIEACPGSAPPASSITSPILTILSLLKIGIDSLLSSCSFPPRGRSFCSFPLRGRSFRSFPPRGKVRMGALDSSP